jgi:hypothetical protein
VFTNDCNMYMLLHPCFPFQAGILPEHFPSESDPQSPSGVFPVGVWPCSMCSTSPDVLASPSSAFTRSRGSFTSSTPQSLLTSRTHRNGTLVTPEVSRIPTGWRPPLPSQPLNPSGKAMTRPAFQAKARPDASASVVTHAAPIVPRPCSWSLHGAGRSSCFCLSQLLSLYLAPGRAEP